MLRLRVLGGFALEDSSGNAVPSLPRRRAEGVLAVLAVCGDLGCTRERLVALLWPESDEAHSRHGLRDALHTIRRVLGPGAVPAGSRLLRLDPAVVDSDVLSFRQALGAGRYADAVRLYAGPLLEGFHVDAAPELEHWLDGERARLSRDYVEALEHLAAMAERDGGWGRAAAWWARAVQHDPLNSHLVVRHVRALAAMGDRANAIKAADVHARRLREEFDLEPDREVLAKVARIRKGGGPTPPAAPRGSFGLPEGGPSAADDSPSNPEPPAPTGGVRPAHGRRLRWTVGAAAVLLLAGVLALGRWLSARAEGARRPRSALAVLPFENLSADPSRAYFAGGLHDELLARLGKVSSLTIVGRRSVSGYEHTSKSLRQIAEELGVGSIVEGSIQVVGNRVRVVVELLDPRNDRQLWANVYDRSLGDVLTVQGDIAREIVGAVGATLTPAEAGAIAAAPTRNAEAYQFFLQGLDYQRRPGLLRRNFEIAQQLYERALALDPAFALGHAELSSVHWGLYELRYDRTAARLEMARREAETALRLAPDLPQAHLAAGLTTYLVRGDQRAALDEFDLGLRGAPNDAELWAWIGRVHRNLGNWDSASIAFDHARKLDPRDADLFVSIGNTLHYLHRYREAIEAYRHALLLAPDLVQPHLSLAWSYVLWKGELDTVRAVLQGLPLDADPGGGGNAVGGQRLAELLWERRPDSILSLLHVMPPAGSESALLVALTQILRRDTAAARAAFDAAASSLTLAERQHPGDWTVHGHRGLALAGLGRRMEALQEADWLERSDAYRNDRYDSGPAQVRARILVRVGEADAALAEIERLLSGPSLLSVGELRLSPEYDPIRQDPRFQALLVKYADHGSRAPGSTIAQ